MCGIAGLVACDQVLPDDAERVVRMRDVLAIDASGLRALEDVLDKSRRDGTTLVLSGVHAQPLVALERSGLLERIGEVNVHRHVRDALARARSLVAAPR